MKKLRIRRIVLLMIVLLIIVLLISLAIFHFRKKSSSDTASNEASYNIKEVYEAFIEEEEYVPEDHPIPKETLENTEIHLSAWIAYWDFNNALVSYKNNTDAIESLSPTWYFMQADGSLGLKNTARNSELINLCINNDTKLIPSISNSNADTLSTILNNDDLLHKHINSITSEAIHYEYDGIDIDYEHIKKTDRDKFSNFIKLLSEQLHANNKALTIAILWKNDLDNIIENFSDSRAAQDWPALGSYVDEFRIMAYDYTGASDTSGPIAPEDWIKSILNYALDNIDDNKIVLGLPFYAYEWNEGVKGAKALVWTDIEHLKSNQSISILKDELAPKTTEKNLIYKIGETNKIIWYQDSEVTQKRIEIAGTYGINKFVFWRLGGEDPKTFENITTTDSN